MKDYDKSNDEDLGDCSKESLLKTLTLEEAIEFIPKGIFEDGHHFLFNIYFNHTSSERFRAILGKVGVCYKYTNGLDYNINTQIGNSYGKTLLQAIEKMLEYLIDNDLLGTN